MIFTYLDLSGFTGSYIQLAYVIGHEASCRLTALWTAVAIYMHGYQSCRGKLSFLP